MAQTKKKRQTKHRGNAAGIVESRGRTSRPPSPEEKKRRAKEVARETRNRRPPSWKLAFRNSGIMAVLIFVALNVLNKGHSGDKLVSALIVAVLAFVLYVPVSYFMERSMWKRRMRQVPAVEVKRGR